MNSFRKPATLTVLCILALTLSAVAQRFDYTDKVFFADSVKKIKVWSYIEGDKSFRRYQDAIESAKKTLNKKGYLVDVAEYDPGSGIPAQEWMNSMIMQLKKNEAFLEIPTSITMSDALGPDRKPQTVVWSENGTTMFTVQYQKDFDSVTVDYFSRASSRVFVNWGKPGVTAMVPVFSRTEKAASRDIYLLVKQTLGGVPASNHPSADWVSYDTIHEKGIPIEICIFGGYTLPSQMDVLQQRGTTSIDVANFNGNAQYGLEISLGLTRNIDINIQYRRMVTLVDVNTPIQEQAGPVRMNMNYMLMGANYNFRVNKLISPYAGIGLGGLNIVPSDTYFRNVWYFFVGTQGGVKLYISKRIGFRLQAELCYSVHAVGAPFLYSSDIYQNIPVDAMSNMLQVGFTGGLILRLGN
jgi:hypothetical protein